MYAYRAAVDYNIFMSVLFERVSLQEWLIIIGNWTFVTVPSSCSARFARGIYHFSMVVNKSAFLVSLLLATTTLTGCSSAALSGGSEELAMKNPLFSSSAVEVRRESGCGCCVSWADYLRKHGASVEVIVDDNLEGFRVERGVSDDAASCHTAIVGNYVVEGHVPVEAIEKLLTAQPKAKGIALPGMPADSPGMGGTEADWAQQKVMLINTDGTLTPWEY